MTPHLFEPRKVVFTAMSKRSFYLREHIIKFVLEQKYTPLAAFMMFSYFLLDTVDRDGLIQANNDLIRISDELWIFGPISGGVQEEIDYADRLGKPVFYYEVIKKEPWFVEIQAEKAERE